MARARLREQHLVRGKRLSMKTKILRRWFMLGTIQLVLSLILAAIAPFFLNSSIPIVGFLIWAGILCMLLGSGTYISLQLRSAAQCRRQFLAQFGELFPDYRSLSTLDFLGIPPVHLADRLEQYSLAAADPDFQSLEISPLAFVRGGL